MYSYLNIVFFHKKHHVTLFFAFHFDSPKIRKAFFDEFQLESIAVDIEPKGFSPPDWGLPASDRVQIFTYGTGGIKKESA